MSLSINTNVMALNARHKLAQSNMQMSKTLEKLSSGLRINRAADDAAGLAVSEKLRSQIKGTAQAMRNAQDGISMIQTAEGALEEVHGMMQRMRELAVQASNDTYSDEDRTAVNSELQALKSEINAISTRTKFNGKQLLTGQLATSLDTTSEVKVGVSVTGGAETAVIADIDVSAAQAGTTFTLSAGTASNELTVTAGGQTQTVALSAIAANGKGEIDFSNLGIKIKLTSAAGITADNLRTAMVAAGNDTVVTAAATTSAAANFQIGSEASNSLSVAFAKVEISASAGALNGLNTALNDFNTTKSVGNAQALITAVDGAIGTVNTRRGDLGSVQNRLDHTIRSLSVGLENLSASESRIRDTDVATETANMVRAQILSQAGSSILAQANQVPQGALALLRG